MTRVALVSSEPIRPVMGGAGIRYLEFARALPAFGLDVVLYSPDPTPSGAGLPDGAVRRLDPGRVAKELKPFDVLVAQGWCADRVIQALPEKPLVVDLYDPWLVENLHYARTLGTTPFRRDLASWRLQGSCGDFFLCASEVQRTFYLGLLTALGRVGPDGRTTDATFRHLIDVVPFGTPSRLPPHRPVMRGE